MHIRHVTIENVRRFGSGAAQVDLDLPPHGWIVIAGRNGAGKTTLLRAIALALCGNFSHDYTDTMTTWLRHGAARAHTRLTLVPSREDEWRDGVDVVSLKGEGEPLVVGVDWQPAHGAMSRGGESDGNRAFAGPWHPDPRGWFSVGYGAFRRQLGGATVTDQWASETSREGAFLTLFRDDAALMHPIRWLMDLDHRSLDPNIDERERNAARSVVAGAIAMLNDGLLDGADAVRVDSRGLFVRQGEAELSVLRLGTGAQVLIGLVVDMLRHMHARFGALRFGADARYLAVEHEGVVLIDEVDAHLHVSWQRRIGPWLTHHFPNVQFIVTTHSPFICQSAAEGGLVILPAPGANGGARVAEADLHRRVVNGSIDDALLSELFGLEHTWTEASELKRDRLAALEARVLTGKALPAEREAYKTLRDEVSPSMFDDVARAAMPRAASGHGGR